MARVEDGFGRPVGCGPVGGEYYDESEDNEELRVAVLWSGKKVKRTYEDKTGLTKVVFTDGSWADLFHRSCHNAGRGSVALADLDNNLIAR